MKWLMNLVSGGLVKSVENIALEAISTPEEKAAASALWIKTLDPNGKMRRDLSRFACIAYGFYLVTAVILIFCHAFGWTAPESSEMALTKITDLFLPITASWGTIVTASFGVNGVNTYKGS